MLYADPTVIFKKQILFIISLLNSKNFSGYFEPSIISLNPFNNFILWWLLSYLHFIDEDTGGKGIKSQCHIGGMWQSWDFNTSILIPEPVLLTSFAMS